MAEKKNTEFDRPGGYATPRGALQVQVETRKLLEDTDIRLLGDIAASHEPSTAEIEPRLQVNDPDTRLYVGDCRDVLPNLPDRGEVDLVFADPHGHFEMGGGQES